MVETQFRQCKPQEGGGVLWIIHMGRGCGYRGVWGGVSVGGGDEGEAASDGVGSGCVRTTPSALSCCPFRCCQNGSSQPTLFPPIPLPLYLPHHHSAIDSSSGISLRMLYSAVAGDRQAMQGPSVPGLGVLAVTLTAVLQQCDNGVTIA
jgi:hypothetical protein